MGSSLFNGLDLSGAVEEIDDNATKRTQENTRAIVGTLMRVIEKTTGGDPVAAEQLTSSMLEGLRSGNLASVTLPSTASSPIAALNSGGATDNEPSEAEKLGEKLLKAHAGDTTRANHSAEFLIHAITGGGQELLRLLVDTVDAVTRTNSPDSVVLENGQRMLASQRSTSRRAEAFEAAFYDALSLIHGSTAAIPVASSKQLLADAKAELDKERRAAATPPAPVNQDPKYLAILERLSGIKANLPGTTFEQHLQVVLDAYSKTGREFATELERVSGITFNNTDSIRVCVEKVANKLRASAPAPTTPTPTSSRELDTIGRKLSMNRNGEIDSAYGARIVTTIASKLDRINTLEGDLRTSETNRKKVEDILKKDEGRANKILRANGTPALPADMNPTPVEIVEAVIRHALNDSEGLRAGAIKRAGGMKKVTLP